MSIISRRNFLYLISSTGFLLTQIRSIAGTIRPNWNSIRKIEMKGNLKAFWNVEGGDPSNKLQAIQHGFQIATGMNSYADYPGKQKENIYNFLNNKYRNPWVKPTFFEKILKRNVINSEKAIKNADIFYHDIEFSPEKNVQELWKDPILRKLSKAQNFESFVEKYYREWGTWYSRPCQLSKQLYPDEPVGIYGPQVFNRDYWGFTKPLQLAQSHSSDLRLWKYIDPYVDYYVSSAYIFYDFPDSIYYLAANVEQNYRLSRNFSDKPLYVFLWLRFHSKSQKELSDYLAVAAAVIPFFTGAKGIVLFGWEPNIKGQPYYTLPIFMNSLGRVADLSAKIDQAQLVVDRPAHELWREKAPLIRKLKVSESEWIIMAVYPWQSDRDRKIVNVKCGNRSVELEISGKHTEIYHLQGNNLAKI